MSMPQILVVEDESIVAKDIQGRLISMGYSVPTVAFSGEEAVQKAVEALPEGEREVLLLSEYNGFKYAEISEILSIPVGTVKSRLSRALARLRQLLEGAPETMAEADR